jgi:hypothetical protein
VGQIPPVTIEIRGLSGVQVGGEMAIVFMFMPADSNYRYFDIASTDFTFHNLLNSYHFLS